MNLSIWARRCNCKHLTVAEKPPETNGAKMQHLQESSRCLLGPLRDTESLAFSCWMRSIINLAILLWAPDISHSETAPVGEKVVLFWDSDTLTPWKSQFAFGLSNYLQNEQKELPNLRIGYDV